MKKIILLSACSFLLALGSFAQSDKYMGAMKKSLSTVDEAMKDVSTINSLADGMERIAKAEKTQWLPYYYAAFFKTSAAFRSENLADEGDQVADAANRLLDIADSLSPNNSEISTVRAMVTTVKMMVDPQGRYMTMGQDIEKNLQAAMKQDPTNPRPYYFKGTSLQRTPEMFGGGCDAASKFLSTAKEKYMVAKPASEISPNWGMEETMKAIKECEGK